MGTIDNIFVLNSLVNHFLNQGRQLFCVFIDFTKAFDYVVRDNLWYKLIKEGVRGKMLDINKKVQVGKDQEKAQSEKDSHSKNRGGKKPNQQPGTYTMKHIVSRMSSYFPNRWPLSYLNLTKI